MKIFLKATNNGIDLTSIYVVKSDFNGDTYLRKYMVFSDKKIYCMNLLNNAILKTNLIDLSDIDKLKNYDDNLQGIFND